MCRMVTVHSRITDKQQTTNTRCCFALLCFALLCFALLCFASLCVALLCCALHCFAVRDAASHTIHNLQGCVMRARIHSLRAAFIQSSFKGYYPLLHSFIHAFIHSTTADACMSWLGLAWLAMAWHVRKSARHVSE